MKILLVIIGLLSYNTLVSAQPYAVCDPQAGVVHYVIEFDGEEFAIDAEPDGSAKYDLNIVDMGPHMIRMMAGNAFGDWSGWSDPFDFTRAIVTTPSGVRLSTH